MRDFRDVVERFDDFDDRPALVMRNFLKVERVTYAELARRSYQVASYLADEGVRRGDRVMVVAPNSPSWVELLLGTELLGAVLVAVDAASTGPTVERYVELTEPVVIFASRRGEPFSASVPVRLLEQLETLIASRPTTPGDHVVAGSTREDPGIIVFTSGTTADPKGVVLTQGNVLANVEGILARVALTPSWRLLSVLPLSHMYELTGTMAALTGGASEYYISRVTPTAIAEALVDYEITTIMAVPELLSLMLARIEQTAAQEGQAKVLALAMKAAEHLNLRARRALFHSVRARLGGHLDLVVTGGAPIPLEVAAAWDKMGLRMLQGYGLTETSPILTCNSLERSRLDSPGWALDNVELRIGDEGEIQARGPSVFDGYWKNPEATRDAFTSDGWFRTGDVGRLEDGWLTIEGRLKFAIVRSSGLKVFPEDIEVVTERDKRVKEICIVGLKGERGESVEAIVLGDAADDVVDDVIRSVNEQLASFQHVDGWRRWPGEDFPRTRLLKVDRRRVLEWVNASGPSAQPVAPTPAEGGADPVVRALRVSLDDPSLSVGDDEQLGDLGLDSLLRLSVASVLEEELGVSIPDEQLSATMTVGQLRELVGEGSLAPALSRPPRWPRNHGVRVVGDLVRDHLIAPLVGHWVTLSVEGEENLAALTTPALFIFNHSDDFDAPVVFQALPPVVRRRLSVAMGADVMADHLPLALIAQLAYNAFPFARSEPYLPSLQLVGDLLDRGWHVLIAPEGRLSVSGELQDFKSGIGLLATNLGVPVVPMKTKGLSGTVPLHAKWPRKKSAVTVCIGQPLRFGVDEDPGEVTQRLRRAVQDL